MESGCLSYYGAARSHLAKLDRIQRRVSKLSKTEFQPLENRRDAAAFGLMCKMLDDVCIAPLAEFKPILHVRDQPKSRRFTAPAKLESNCDKYRKHCNVSKKKT